MTPLWDQVWPAGHFLPCVLPVPSDVDPVTCLYWCVRSGAMPWNHAELVLEQNGDLACSPPQTTSDTHCASLCFVCIQVGRGFSNNCYKLEMSTMPGICMFGTDLSFVSCHGGTWEATWTWSPGFMKERVVSLIISHGASQKAMLSLPFPYLREPFLWPAKITLLSGYLWDMHVLQFYLVTMPVWIILEKLLHYYVGSSQNFHSLFL